MEVLMGTGEEEEMKKRGRKKKDEKRVFELNKEQNKFFIDLSKDKEGLGLVQDLLFKVNQKEQGREINFKDLVLFSLAKLTEKDLEKIKDSCLSEMEKVERLLFEHNEKNKTQLSLGEFLLKKLNIN